MSVYQQPDYRYPPRYPGPAYAYPSPPPLPLPPVPQPYYQVDPVSFRRDYTARLAELTVNSRPIIQSLSMLAQDYVRFAEIVAQCIEGHIRKVPPWMKLPAFYLLDAITKNVFEPYAREFANFVIPLFLGTYDVVDQSTRSKMEEMLITWRNSSPTGKELFGVPVQAAIERGVWGGSSFETNRPDIPVSQVLSELEFTLSQKERGLKLQPYDSNAINQINVLRKLREVVQRGVSQEELRAILEQLRSMMRSQPGPPPPQQPPRPPIPAAPQWAPPPAQPPTPSYPHFTPAQPSPPPVPQFNFPPPVPSTSHVPVPPAPVVSLPAPSAPAAVPTPTLDISAILSNLLKAGVVSTGKDALANPVAGSSAGTPEVTKSDGAVPRALARDYRRAILQHPMRLNGNDLIRIRTPVVSFLYDKLPLKCKQCSARFLDNAESRKALEKHLDEHFEQNRRATQNTGRGFSRSWFVSLEDWIHDSNGKGKGRVGGTRPLNTKATAEERAKRNEELRAQFVVIPRGDEAKSVSCPICKEHIKSEFMEDDEEWVWKNALMKDGKVYHATCHDEASASTSTLVARLKSEANNRSRSTTPDHTMRASRSPGGTPTKTAVFSHSLLASVASSDSLLGKRKAEAGAEFPKADTPPLKKLTPVFS